MLNIDALIGSNRYAGLRIKFRMLASELNLTWPVYIFITSYRDEEIPISNASGAEVESTLPQGPTSIIHAMKREILLLYKPHMS